MSCACRACFGLAVCWVCTGSMSTVFLPCIAGLCSSQYIVGPSVSSLNYFGTTQVPSTSCYLVLIKPVLLHWTLFILCILVTVYFIFSFPIQHTTRQRYGYQTQGDWWPQFQLARVDPSVSSLNYFGTTQVPSTSCYSRTNQTRFTALNLVYFMYTCHCLFYFLLSNTAYNQTEVRISNSGRLVATVPKYQIRCAS